MCFCFGLMSVFLDFISNDRDWDIWLMMWPQTFDKLLQSIFWSSRLFQRDKETTWWVVFYKVKSLFLQSGVESVCWVIFKPVCSYYIFNCSDLVCGSSERWCRSGLTSPHETPIRLDWGQWAKPLKLQSKDWSPLHFSFKYRQTTIVVLEVLLCYKQVK